MKYICVYTDLVNQGLTYKAEIECDGMEIVEGIDNLMIGFVVTLESKKTDKYVFLMHDHRVIECYAAEYVTISTVDKKSLNSNKIKSSNLISVK